MRRQYFIHFYRPFANTYNLYYADTPKMLAGLPYGALRTSKKDALRYVKEELDRKRYHSSASNFASSAIYPAGYPEDEDIQNDPNYVLKNHIWERAFKEGNCGSKLSPAFGT